MGKISHNRGEVYVKVLRQVKKALAYGGFTYICRALEEIEYDALANSKEERAARHIRHYIAKCLGGEDVSLERYLNDYHGIKAIDYRLAERKRYRQRWLNHLIKEFSPEVSHG